MLNKKRTNSNKLTKPLLTIPKIPSEEVRFCLPKKVKVYEFYSISDGCSRIFKEEDGIDELARQKILPPSEISYMNLFINGVLQPKESYDVQKGILQLKTVDVPAKGAPVILQMFIV